MSIFLIMIFLVLLGIWLDIKGTRYCSLCGGVGYSPIGTRCPVCEGKGKI
jgi:hypothetical protein